MNLYGVIGHDRQAEYGLIARRNSSVARAGGNHLTSLVPVGGMHLAHRPNLLARHAQPRECAPRNVARQLGGRFGSAFMRSPVPVASQTYLT